MRGTALLDPKIWYPVGRAHGYDFYATDEEVAEILVRHLPPEYGPYSVVGYDLVKEDRNYVQVHFDDPLEAYISSRKMWGNSLLRIRAHALTPEIPLERGQFDYGISAVNGLVGLQGVRQEPEGLDLYPALLHIVDEVGNKDTYELIVHTEYRDIFNRLKRELNKILAYRLIRRYRTPEGAIEQNQLRRGMVSEGMRKVIDDLGSPWILVGDKIESRRKTPKKEIR